MLATINFPKVDAYPFRFGDKGARGKKSFIDWLRGTHPRSWTWDWNYQVFIQNRLNRLTTGTGKQKLMFFLPPRMGKSEMLTVRYPVYRLCLDPKLRVIIGAYSQTLADNFSRKARRLARERIAISDERTAVQEWQTVAGGGMRAVGVGGGITGHGAELILIDDPVKSRKEANSKVYRDMTWDWYRDDLYTRAEPGAAIVLTMTRWHEDDLAGRILRSDDAENWEVVSLPAIAEANDPLGREAGEALNPERYPVEKLHEIKQVLGDRSFNALYQQRPQEQEGEMFKRSKFGFVDAVPEGSRFVRWWDKAATANDGDFTAGVLMAKTPDGHYIVADVTRGQWSTYSRDQIIRTTAESDRTKYGDVAIWGEQEPGSAGKDVAAEFVRLLDGYSVHTEPSTGDKQLRAEPFSSQVEGGNVSLLRAAWNEDFIDELATFPTGTHDDQVDAAASAYVKLIDDRMVRFIPSILG